MYRITKFKLLATVFVLFSSQMSFALEFDSNFGDHGKIVAQFNWNYDSGNFASLAQMGDSFFVAGKRYDGIFEVKKYDMNGKPDATFSSPAFPIDQRLAARTPNVKLAPAHDDSLYVVWNFYGRGSEPGREALIYKINATTGELLRSFGNNGVVSYPSGNWDTLAGFVVDSQNRLLFSDFDDIRRLLPNGDLDATFHVKPYEYPSTMADVDYMILDSQDRIFIFGRVEGSYDRIIGQTYLSDGTLDINGACTGSSFPHFSLCSGRMIHAFPDGAGSYPWSSSIDEHNRFSVNIVWKSNDRFWAISKFDSSGILDLSFGIDGVVYVPGKEGEFPDRIRHIVSTPTGGALVIASDRALTFDPSGQIVDNVELPYQEGLFPFADLLKVTDTTALVAYRYKVSNGDRGTAIKKILLQH